MITSTLLIKEQFTQTLITQEDIEVLIQGLKPNKKLLIDIDRCDEKCLISSNRQCANKQRKDQTKEVHCQSDETKSKLEQEGQSFSVENISEPSASHVPGEQQAANHVNEKENWDAVQSSQASGAQDVCIPQRTRELRSRKSKINSLIDRRSCIVAGDVHKGKKTQEKRFVTKCHEKLQKSKTHKGKLNKQSIADEVGDEYRDNNSKIKKKVSSPFKCSYCSKEFATKKNLGTHVWVHEKNKSYSCNTCEKKFLRANELRLHVRIHTGEKPYSCKSCDKSFTNSSAAARHQKIHSRKSESSTPSAAAAHNCPECGKTFTQKGNLTVHMKIHTKTYDHVCDICKKSFITSGDLKRHLRVHSKEKPYTCDICKKSFTASSTLVCHRRLHSGERPYLCGVCGASFSVLCHLKQHNRIHVRGDLWPRKKGSSDSGGSIRKKMDMSLTKADQIDMVSTTKEGLSTAVITLQDKSKQGISDVVDKDLLSSETDFVVSTDTLHIETGHTFDQTTTDDVAELQCYVGDDHLTQSMHHVTCNVVDVDTVKCSTYSQASASESSVIHSSSCNSGDVSSLTIPPASLCAVSSPSTNIEASSAQHISDPTGINFANFGVPVSVLLPIASSRCDEMTSYVTMSTCCAQPVLSQTSTPLTLSCSDTTLNTGQSIQMSGTKILSALHNAIQTNLSSTSSHLTFNSGQSSQNSSTKILSAPHIAVPTPAGSPSAQLTLNLGQSSQISGTEMLTTTHITPPDPSSLSSSSATLNLGQSSQISGTEMLTATHNSVSDMTTYMHAASSIRAMNQSTASSSIPPPIYMHNISSLNQNLQSDFDSKVSEQPCHVSLISGAQVISGSQSVESQNAEASSSRQTLLSSVNSEHPSHNFH